jgi:hypothetical protein
VQALVQTFHIDRDHLADLAAGLDAATERFTQDPNFGGLLCLERTGGVRVQMTVVVLWRGAGSDDFIREAEQAHRLIAATTDLGVSSHYHRVVRFVPGVSELMAALLPVT